RVRRASGLARPHALRRSAAALGPRGLSGARGPRSRPRDGRAPAGFQPGPGRCLGAGRAASGGGRRAVRPAPILPLLTLSTRNEADVVLVRQRARTVAELLGLPSVDQTRVATAVSEIARNALVHGRGGAARFSAGGTPPAMHVAVEDRGTGLGASGWSLG